MSWKTAVILVTAAASFACRTPSRDLLNTESSPEALARRLLEAIAANDLTRVVELALSEVEFRKYVWPALPAARSERNLPFSYVWGDLVQKSTAGLRKTILQHRGVRYEFQRVEFDGATTNYGTFSVHRQARFVVRQGDRQGLQLRLCGSFFEMDGRWKVFSYVVDD